MNPPCKHEQAVAPGLDLLAQGYQNGLKGAKLGLVFNQASVDKNLRPAKEVISSLFPGGLKALFGPQHGAGGEDQDNMVETPHAIDPDLNIPIYSLYSETREPTAEMLDCLDVLIVDLQDVGTRVYTFASTMLQCMRAVAREGKKLVVLDRPNPLDGTRVEGNLLEQEFFSFVGPWRLPMRHGLTMAEMALLFRDAFKLDCDLEVVPMAGWKREMLWPQTGLRWIMPSPNMPSYETALVYPGQVIWEGTNLSEGRGTCRPFEIFGAPFLEPKRLQVVLDPGLLRGCLLQEFRFRPTFHKWTGKLCKGFFLHVVEPQEFTPYRTSLALLQAVMRLYPDKFEWRPPPYEYEHEKLPMDLILGSRALREKLESLRPISQLEGEWEEDLEEYRQIRQKYLLYQ